jgi:hypothetical protein
MRGSILATVIVAAALALAVGYAAHAGVGYVDSGAPSGVLAVADDGAADACEIAPVVCSPILTVDALTAAIVAPIALLASAALLMLTFAPTYAVRSFTPDVIAPPPRPGS